MGFNVEKLRNAPSTNLVVVPLAALYLYIKWLDFGVFTGTGGT